MKPSYITTLFNIRKHIKVNSAWVNQQSFPFPLRAKERWRLLIRIVEWLRNYMLYIKILFFLSDSTAASCGPQMNLLQRDNK